ncbi:MAG TPA: DEAD/DEAH box helicase [Acidimicrobiales bacterium]|jgi:superfamily II DNA/RNA helicase|nr:DEAD/DEAH box helicase [Acidimicrobiales bacterium]
MRNDDQVTFSALGVSSDLVAVLDEAGLTTAFPVQRLCIPDALAGRDVCGKAKTGSGKTLAFGIPLIERVKPASAKRPTGLVLVPTRELAIQVADVLKMLAEARSLRLVAVYGGAQMSKQISALEKGVEIVVATPGRLIDLIDRGVADLSDIGVVVIDEADRMADMGFMPQVEWVLRHIEGTHQTLLFSATLDGGIQGLVDRYQRDPVFHEVGSPTHTVDKMAHRFLLVHEMDKHRVAAAIARSASRCLVFTNTKRAADKLARQLEGEGVDAKAIHGDLRQEVRERALKRFANGKLRALVATDVAARGLDIDELDVVIQADPAPDPKTYLHRAGRTARAGATGLAVTLVLWNEELDVRRLKRRLGLDEPIVEMFSNDKRLADLASWNPAAEGAA